ncbi:hypothetical protein ACP70R_047358 [Stipagrostis hirtigluma subsp. patula]
MMRSRLALVVAVLLAAAAALPAGADADPEPEGAGDPAVLELVNVVSGETQPVGDGTTDYRLVLNVRDNAVGTTAQFQCVVRGRPGSRSNTWKLLSFKPYKQ